MFKKIFIDLCNKKRESPSSVCRKVGITPATFSGWTEATIPRKATLQRIADYFGVTVNCLLGESDIQPSKTIGLTEAETALLVAYRAHPEMHEAVHKLLGIETKEDDMWLAAAPKVTPAIIDLDSDKVDIT